MNLAARAASHAPRWMTEADLLAEAFLNPEASPEKIVRLVWADIEGHAPIDERRDASNDRDGST